MPRAGVLAEFSRARFENRMIGCRARFSHSGRVVEGVVDSEGADS